MIEVLSNEIPCQLSKYRDSHLQRRYLPLELLYIKCSSINKYNCVLVLCLLYSLQKSPPQRVSISVEIILIKFLRLIQSLNDACGKVRFVVAMLHVVARQSVLNDSDPCIPMKVSEVVVATSDCKERSERLSILWVTCNGER